MTPKPRKKPGPKPRIPSLLEGRDYFCGTCTGHRTVTCDYCVDGCRDCAWSGQVRCPGCQGGTAPVPPPTYL